jgi:hypothetical protein
MHSDEGYVLRALKVGARGYILKNSADADLIRAVRTVSEGKSFFSPVISKMLLEDYIRQLRDKEVEDSYDLLTPREREILQFLAEGRTNKEVANILKLSLVQQTPRVHTRDQEDQEHPPKTNDQGETQPASGVVAGRAEFLCGFGRRGVHWPFSVPDQIARRHAS